MLDLEGRATVAMARRGPGVHPNHPTQRSSAGLGYKDGAPVSDRDDFLAWVRTALYEAELALHNGDAAPRPALWSRNEPVSILGALRNVYGQHEVDEAFHFPRKEFLRLHVLHVRIAGV